MYMYKEVNLHYVNLKLYMYEKKIVNKNKHWKCAIHCNITSCDKILYQDMRYWPNYL